MNKPHVVPGINSPDFKGVARCARIAESFRPSPRWLHIDVTDGVFTPHLTWNVPDELPNISTSLPVEVHLMTARPESVVDAWLRNGAQRVIVHLEAMTDPVYILGKCEKYGAGSMLAIGPQTEAERLLAHTDFPAFQVLAVPPGLMGQEFREDALEKVRFLRASMPDATIEVDGGVNDTTAPRIIAAGADLLVSASHIFGSGDPQAAYERLNRWTSSTKKS